MADRFVIPKRQGSEDGVQRTRGKRQGSEAYIFHRGQLCHIGVGKDSNLYAKNDQFMREIQLRDRYGPC